MSAKALAIAASSLLAWAAALSAAAAQPEALIYRCERNGSVAFADRPCALDAQPLQRPPETLSTYEPVLPPEPPAEGRLRASAAGANATASRKPPGAQIATRKIAQRLRCQQLQVDIDRVNSLMRAGYHGQRGEALRARWHTLKDHYYDERCLGLH